MYKINSAFHYGIYVYLRCRLIKAIPLVLILQLLNYPLLFAANYGHKIHSLNKGEVEMPTKHDTFHVFHNGTNGHPDKMGLERRTVFIDMKTSTPSQKIIVTGTVRDSVGVLPGVSITVKGTKIGTKSDSNGKFTLDVPDGQSIVVFTMIGFITKEVVVADQQVLNVVLTPDVKGLNEVVVVAFGTQKKTELVGSVTSINVADLKVPSSNLTTALAGRAAGVIAYQRSGEPGQDNADFFIRGVTTFGYKTSPLILIDGMELSTKELARLQPQDIASFSIMKDATSTALYGARGANGVILVTTKQGKVGRANLSMTMENSFSKPTQTIELADPVTYMRMSNEALYTRTPLGSIPSGSVTYSDEKIANTAAGKNPLLYPATDWKKMMFKDYTTNQRVNMNISGGGGVAVYFVSGSYNKDNGIMNVDQRNNFNNNIDLKSYALRSNVTIDVTKSTEMIVRLSGNFDDYSGPINGGADMYQKVMRTNPVLFPAYYPIDEDHQFVKHIMFGNYQGGDYLNPYAEMTKGYKDYSSSLMLAQIELKQNLDFFTKGLSFRTMVNTNRTSYFDVSRSYNPYYYGLGGYDTQTGTYSINQINPQTGTEYLGYIEGPKQVSSAFYMESMLNYRNSFKKHGFSGLLVYMMRDNRSANAGDLQQSLPFRNLGLSGRATYSYDDRLFAEFNFGYNGSERFYKSKRFGFFPSAGLAWAISKEKFFKPLADVVTNLKLRATYGLIGNDAIGAPSDRFFYLSNVNMNDGARGAYFGRDFSSGQSLTGVSTSRYSNEEITWETSEQKNIALEIGLFNKLNIVAEYYQQHRKNILMTRAAIPSTSGFSAPIRANVGEATAKGTDLEMVYSDRIGTDLTFSVRGNFTYATSKFKVFEEPIYNEFYRSHVGNSLAQNYGYIAERLFVDDEEALNSPRQNFGVYGGGDIKYTDVNRDGKITEADIVPIGNPTSPEVVYGFGFSAGYKGFDFGAFFQGLSNESFWMDVNATSPFASYAYPGEALSSRVSNQVLKAYADSYWSEDNRNIYALWPRLSQNVNNNNAQPNTWFMRDGSFLRLKQLEVGFTFPQRISKKMGMSNLRLYVSGSNLLTFSKFKLWDVEMGANGLGYPVQKVYNLGLKVDFN